MSEERKEQVLLSSYRLYGRKKIFTVEENITAENVISVVTKAVSLHTQNLNEEEYLYWYRRGKQPILNRTREIRSELTKQVVVNNSNMIVTFKNGYFLVSPTSYYSLFEDKQITDNVKLFNDFCNASGKAIADNEIVDWFHTVGLGVQYVEPDRDGSLRHPFHTYALDPRSAFNVYSYRPGNRRVMGINIVIQGEETLFDVFTKEWHFLLKGGSSHPEVSSSENQFGSPNEVVSYEKNIIGEIPIIEYQYDVNRMSSFEAAIPICDEINEMQSQLAEGIEEQIQQLCVAYNCQFDEGITANDIRRAGMLVLRSQGVDGGGKADFKLLESNISQNEVQNSIDSLYDQLLDKTGLPSIGRDDGGTSDNGSAVYLRSGYSIADTHRRNTEDYWRKSDREFRRVALAILKFRFPDFVLDEEDFEIDIEPPTMSNLLVKTQAALNMRTLGLAPEIWLERSGLSSDPLTDIELSKEYIYKFYESEQLPRMSGTALNDAEQIEEVPSLEVD